MNAKLKRLVRTPYSEQYALFDQDQIDEEYDPVLIGKLDLHYTDEGVFGTLLLWRDFIDEFSNGGLQSFIDDLLSEFIEPAGVVPDYAIEFFSPDLAEYQFYASESDEYEEDDGDLIG